MLLRAHVVLKGPGGGVASTTAGISAETVRSYASDPSARERVKSALEQHGFHVRRVSPLSIAVEAPRQQFEKFFKRKIRRITLPAGATPGAEPYWSWEDSPEIPDDLRDVIDTVVFPKPVKPLIR